MAQKRGLDFNRMRQPAQALYATLHGGLTEAGLRRWNNPSRYQMARVLADQPGLADWLRFKADLVEELLGEYRSTLTAAGEKALLPNAFPPPFCLVSGFDFARAARHCQGIAVKLYSMHWSMILRFYADQLLQKNPRLPENKLIEFLLHALEISDAIPAGKRVADYRYPNPNKPHLAGPRVQRQKIEQAQADAGSVPVFPLVHGYGPIDDFRRRLEAGWRASAHGVWINRYGYLSDEKLKIVTAVCR